MLTILGVAAVIISAMIQVPQGLRTWRLRHDPATFRVLSPGTYSLVWLNGIIWVIWSAAAHQIVPALPSLISIPISTFILTQIARHRTRRPSP